METYGHRPFPASGFHHLRGRGILPTERWYRRCQPAKPGWQPPIPVTHERDQRWHEKRTDDGGVEQDAGCKDCSQDFDLRLGGSRHRGKGEEENQRGAGDEAAGEAEPANDRGVVVAGSIPLLTYS